ncbi:MAG TPA: hypothetical protein ENN86_01330 [Desulfobacteraceae bacterium]|nr:hypothetical protein [Desulfobacteraceae bacterium]
MNINIQSLKNADVFLCSCIVCCLIITSGCHTKKTYSPDAFSAFSDINKIVVVGFRPVVPHDEKTITVRSPLSGSVFVAGPIPPEVIQPITDMLFERLIAESKCELVSPGQAEGVYSSIVDSDKDAGIGTLEILQMVGNKFGSDALLAGFIYRWEEREGSDYAVNRPASVAFDLYLIRPTDGAILWRGKFDKTQRSLTENLMDLKTFVQGKGQWMTAEKLALIGLNKLLNEIPICINR